MVAARPSPRAPTPSTRSRSCPLVDDVAGRSPTASSTSAAVRARWRAGCAEPTAPSSSWASIPTRRPGRRGGPAGRGAGLRSGRAPAPCRSADGSLRRRRGLPGVRAHRRRSTRPSPRWPGCSRPAVASCFFLNHPLLQTPGQRLDRRPDPRSARAVLADRSVPARGGDRSSRSRRACSSASSTVRSAATSTRWPPRARARADGRAGAAGRLPRAGARVRRSGHHPAPGGARDPEGRKVGSPA